MMVPRFEWKNQMILLVLVVLCEFRLQINPQQSPSLEPSILLAWLKPDDESGPDGIQSNVHLPVESEKTPDP